MSCLWDLHFRLSYSGASSDTRDTSQEAGLAEAMGGVKVQVHCSHYSRPSSRLFERLCCFLTGVGGDVAERADGDVEQK